MGLLGLMFPAATLTLSRAVRLRTFFAGATACVLAVAFALSVSGSFRGYWLWCWKIPYVGNRYLLAIDWHRTFFAGWDEYRTMATLSVVSAVAAIAAGILPARALPFALTTPIVFLGAALQARGYGYQFIPTTAAFHLLLLVALSSLWAQSGDPAWSRNSATLAAIALVFVGTYAFQNIETSQLRWDGHTPWDKPTQHFADTEKDIGRYIKQRTLPTDTVLAYGGEASVVLFHAQRRTASPFFHAFWLDPVGLLPRSEIKPGPKELAAPKLQTETRSVACAAIERNRPAVFALNDAAGLFSMCPNVQSLIHDGFTEATTFGTFHVYLSNGRAAHPPPAASIWSVASTTPTMRSIGSGWAIGNTPIGADFAIYRWDTTTRAWQQVSGQAQTLSVNLNGVPFIVNAAHEIYKWDGVSSWLFFGGGSATCSGDGPCPTSVASGSRDDETWVIDKKNAVWNWNGSTWTQPTTGAGSQSWSSRRRTRCVGTTCRWSWVPKAVHPSTPSSTRSLRAF